MDIKSFFKSTKGKVITIGGTAVIAVGIAVALLLQGEGYRSIAVEDITGNVNVIGEKNNGQAYKGQRLYGGDDVNVLEESSLTMCMDNDKYVYADSNTHFRLEDSSTKDSSKIKLVMDRGSELNVLNTKLGANDYYEVDTPNSTMSVRGTTFRVTVYPCEDGFVYCLLEVSEGNVLSELKTENGEYNGISKTFGPGESALIRGNLELSEFVVGKDGSDVLHLDYDNLPEDGMERLIALLGEYMSENSLDAEAVNRNETSKNDKETEKEIKEKEPIPTPTEHAHDPGDWEIVKKANCSSTGLKQRVCKECGEVVDEESIAKTDHTPGEWTTINPTCVDNGLRTQKCTVCGTVLNSETIKAKGHIPGELEVYADATCENVGISIRYCTVCHMTLETGIISALGHEFAGASCTEPMTCSRCGQKSGSALGHDFVMDTNDQKRAYRPDGSPYSLYGHNCRICGYKEYRDSNGNLP